MKTLILDNYDSFTFNLYQYVAELHGNPVVFRNDMIDLDAVRDLKITHIIIGPGPGNPYTPGDIGIAEELIDYAFEERIPLLGVCLGHQILAKHYGATVSRAPTPYHGKASAIRLENGSPLFSGLGREIRAMRYHSLCAEENSIPGELKITALSGDGVVMAIEHLRRPLYGVQFHPESVGTPSGKKIIRNFLSIQRSHPMNNPERVSTRGSYSRQHPVNFVASLSTYRQPRVDTRSVGRKNQFPQKLFSSGKFGSIYDLVTALISGNLSEEKRKEFFSKLVSMPLSSEIVVQAVTALSERMIPVDLSPEAIDTCGTGGSGKRTINTSTLTAFVVAAAGGKVAKHGNRSASGNCGCFDLLEKLGVRIALTPDAERKIFEELGIVFLFAPQHHPALKFVAPIRKKFGKKTIFNLLGPLLNPAGVRRQLIGTGNAFDAKLLSDALELLGTGHSFVVSGMDGLDEISVCAPSIVHEIVGKRLPTKTAEESRGCPFQKALHFIPSDLGLPLARPQEIEGGSIEENAEIFLEIAKGRGRVAHRNLVLVNAAHALLLARAGSSPTHQPRTRRLGVGRCGVSHGRSCEAYQEMPRPSGRGASLNDCFLQAKETLASGKVFELFCRYRDLSQKLR